MRWTKICILVFCTLFLGGRGADFLDFESAGGLSCPKRNSCSGYRNDKPFLYRSCECDPDCTTYGDCCIDAEKISSAPGVTRTDLECVQYGYNKFTGVYAVSKCDDKWNGSIEIKQKCEGPTDFRDPTSAAPVTNPTQSITYRNLHCAECNYAEKESLKSYPFEYACGVSGVSQILEDEINDRLTYNQERNKWGVYVRIEEDGQPTFEECEIIFDVPAYLNQSVRFCRANIVSKCSNDWMDTVVRQLCHEYTSVVYDGLRGFKNPHCAICSHGVTSQLSCSANRVDSRKMQVSSTGPNVLLAPPSFKKFVYFNKPYRRCPESQVFDRIVKKCRKLVCLLPGYVIRENKCVKGDK